MKKTSIWLAVAVTGLTQGAFLLSQGARPDFARAAPVTLAAPAPDAYRVDAQSARELQDKITAAATAVQQALKAVSALEAPPATLKTAVVEAGQRMENAQAGLTQKQKAEANGEKIGNNARVLLDRQRTGHYLLDALNATDVRLQEATESLDKLARPLPAGVSEAVKTAGARVQEALAVAQSDFDALDAKIDDKTKAQMRESVARLASIDAILERSKESLKRGAKIQKQLADTIARSEQLSKESEKTLDKEADYQKRVERSQEEHNVRQTEIDALQTQNKRRRKELDEILARGKQAKTRAEKQKYGDDLKAFGEREYGTGLTVKTSVTSRKTALPSKGRVGYWHLTEGRRSTFTDVPFILIGLCDDLRAELQLKISTTNDARMALATADANLTTATAQKKSPADALFLAQTALATAEQSVTTAELELRGAKIVTAAYKEDARIAREAAVTAYQGLLAAQRALEATRQRCLPGDPDLTAAEAAVTAAQEAYDTALEAAESAESALDRVSQSEDKARANLENKQLDRDRKQLDRDRAQLAVDRAQLVVDTAQAAYDQAEFTLNAAIYAQSTTQEQLDANGCGNGDGPPNNQA